jgi:pimeloyl-ACP methyl ester carboxylesterase
VTTFASYDGVRLSFTTVGEGPPLVCVAGGPGRAAAYLEDLAGLSAARSLVLLDLRATGHSEVPGDPGSLRFDRMAQDLEALREHLCLETLDVLAHSAGCIVTQAWASAHPERVGALVLVTPSDRLQGGTRADLARIRALSAGEPWYADAQEAQDALDEGTPPSQQAALERATRPFFYGRWDARTQEHAASADRQSSKRAQLGFATGLEEVDVARLLAGLAQVTAPVLVVGGSKDALTGLESVAAVAGCFPRATTAVVPGAGHFPWVDEPEGFRSAVAGFLGTV